jgi:hypothetical protein
LYGLKPPYLERGVRGGFDVHILHDLELFPRLEKKKVQLRNQSKTKAKNLMCPHKILKLCPVHLSVAVQIALVDAPVDKFVVVHGQHQPWKEKRDKTKGKHFFFNLGQSV